MTEHLDREIKVEEEIVIPQYIKNRVEYKHCEQCGRVYNVNRVLKCPICFPDYEEHRKYIKQIKDEEHEKRKRKYQQNCG